MPTDLEDLEKSGNVTENCKKSGNLSKKSGKMPQNSRSHRILLHEIRSHYSERASALDLKDATLHDLVIAM